MTGVLFIAVCSLIKYKFSILIPKRMASCRFTIIFLYHLKCVCVCIPFHQYTKHSKICYYFCFCYEFGSKFIFIWWPPKNILFSFILCFVLVFSCLSISSHCSLFTLKIKKIPVWWHWRQSASLLIVWIFISIAFVYSNLGKTFNFCWMTVSP